MFGHRDLKILYLAAPKTASVSTGEALVEYGFDRTLNHHGLLEQAKTYYDITNEWKILTTVRNHWDTIVSWCMFRPYIRKTYGVCIDGVKHLMKCDAHLIKAKSLGDFLGGQFWWQHAPYATHILRFETLQEDLNAALGFDLSLPHENKSEHREDRPYQEFYDEETKEFVAKLFSKEIKQYGYSFGT